MVGVASEWERLLDVAAGMAERLADQARQRIEDALDELTAREADGVWRQAERSLRDHYERLRESLAPLNLGWGYGTSGSTPAHPLGSHASFRRPAGYLVSDDEQLVTTLEDPGAPPVIVTVDFWQKDGELRYTSEVSRRGTVLREGPSGVIAIPNGVIAAYGPVKAVIAQVGQFVEEAGPLIRANLGG